MRNILDRLMSGHVVFRVLSVSVCLLATALLCWWGVIQPRQQHLREQEQQNQQSARGVALLQQKIAALPAPEPLPERVATRPFSAMAAVKQSGGRLVKWQPAPHGAVLEMLLPWPKVPLFFQQLADHPRLKVAAFVLSGAGEQVRVLLTLEFTHEGR